MKLSQRRKKTLEVILDLVFFIAGSAVFGVGVQMFAIPNRISNGGVTGIATIINYLLPILPVGATMLLLNIPLFIIALRKLGRGLFIKSFASTVIMSVVTDAMAAFVPVGTRDRLLAAVFYGVCSGVGLSLIFMRGATSGGFDIPGKLLERKFPHIPLGRILFALDCVVITASGFVLGSLEDTLYAAVVVFISGEIIDMTLSGRSGGRAFLVISDKAENIASAVMENLGRGVTLVPVRGGFTNNKSNMLICAVRANETAKLNKLIKQFDPAAFTVTLRAGEITGEGFKTPEGEEK